MISVTEARLFDCYYPVPGLTRDLLRTRAVTVGSAIALDVSKMERVPARGPGLEHVFAQLMAT